MRPSKLSRRAIRDIAAARRWYDQHGPDLGDKFLDAVREAIRFARRFPEASPERPDGARTARCRRFPYRVYYGLEADRIVILAVYHTSRDPNRWSDPRRD